MSIETYLACINQLHNVLSSLANGDVEWVLTDCHSVLFVSAKADEVLGIYKGMSIKENVWLEETLNKEIRITRRQRGWRGHDEFSSKIVGLPLRDESEKVNGVLLYATAEQTMLKPEDILGLLQEINHEKDMETALKILTRRSLDLFNVSIAGIWLLQENGFKLLAISACDIDQEKFLSENLFPTELSIFENSNEHNQVSLEHKMILQDLEDLNSDTSGDNEPTKPFAAWASKLLGFGIKRLLCIPLLHFEQVLGVLTLFGSDTASFDGVSIHWLNQLIPLISSFVYEQQMRLAAVEREQALTLLLWGTEILVQAESEEQLLTEAGEMAMILYLEAGFFFIQEEKGWEIKAPFGRLKQNNADWEEWLFKQMKIISKRTTFPVMKHMLVCLTQSKNQMNFLGAKC